MAWLLAFGGSISQVWMSRRFSTASKCGAIVSGAKLFKPYLSTQCLSVSSGVRKLVVQLTVVPPPTDRPWKTMKPLSLVRCWPPSM